MNTSNPFVLQPDEYGRDLNVVKHYIHDTAWLISRKTGKPYEYVSQWIRKKISDGTVPFKDPKMLTLVRGENGDREVDSGDGTYLGYLENIEREGLIVSPTMTTYLPPHKKKSLLSEYIEENIERRDRFKEESKIAKMDGNKEIANFKNILQSLMKIFNNSISGGHGSPGTPLFNLSAHPTLTSTCRCATSYANANNERFLTGSRHYWSYEIAQANIMSIVANFDYVRLEEVVEMYGITIPTVEDVMTIITASCKPYWRGDDHMLKLRHLVESLTDMERCAYAYTQDCYTLAQLNPDLVQTMIMEFASCPTVPIDNPDHYINNTSKDLLALVSVIASKHVDGRRLEVVKEQSPESYGIIGATAKNVLQQLDRYRDIITVFWRTNHVPPSVYNIPSAIRKTVLLSDTDSTVFTVANWVEWIYGKVRYDNMGMAVAATMVYLASQTLIHILALFSANMGVEKKRIHQLEMKNEYMMETLIMTGKAKHYAYRTIVKEGNVFKNPEMEIKGVTLRNSRVPSAIMKGVRQTMTDIMDDIRDNGKVKLTDYLRRVAEIERDILNSIKHGTTDYLTSTQIQAKSAYKNPMSQAYYYYLLWNTVFGDKYGYIGTLPSRAVKVSMSTDTKTKLNQWIESIEDVNIKTKMADFIKETKRNYLSMLLVPTEVLKNGTIPDEIISGSNVRKTIYNTVEAHYLILESLSYHCNNDKLTRLISDNY